MEQKTIAGSVIEKEASLESNAFEVVRPLLLSTVVNEIKNLPTLPTVAAYLLNHSDETIHVPDFIKMLSYDQVLTAKSLQFANSAFVGSQKGVKTLQQALALLGLANMRKMVSVAAVSGLIIPYKCPDFDIKAFWRHSIAIASIASAIAKEMSVSTTTAFTCGLLHDMGRVVLACCFSSEYTQVLRFQQQNNCALIYAEDAVLSLQHVEVGIELAKAWRLGVDITDCIEYHHDVSCEKDPLAKPLPSIIYLANFLIDNNYFFDTKSFETLELPTMWADLGLADDTFPLMLVDAKKSYNDAISAVTLSD